MRTEDRIDQRRAQWTRELPGLNTIGMAILGRARWITLKVRPPIEENFAQAGLDSGEFDVLATLLRCGSPYCMRPTELYQSLMISSGGLTDRLKRLQNAGLVQRGVADGDGRSLPVMLTKEGRRRTEAVFRKDMELEQRLLAGLSQAELKTLDGLLRKLVLSLDER